MNLFRLGDFALRSGVKSRWKIECDALTAADWEALAVMAAEILPPFSAVCGVPRGGVPFAEALSRHVTPGADTLLIAEDVVTTGGSIVRWRKVLEDDPQTILPTAKRGVCVFARGDCPAWITPLFRLTLPWRKT